MPSGPQLPQLYLELSLMNYLRGLEVPRGPLLHSFFPNALDTLPVCEGPDIQRDVQDQVIRERWSGLG